MTVRCVIAFEHLYVDSTWDFLVGMAIECVYQRCNSFAGYCPTDPWTRCLPLLRRSAMVNNTDFDPEIEHRRPLSQDTSYVRAKKLGRQPYTCMPKLCSWNTRARTLSAFHINQPIHVIGGRRVDWEGVACICCATFLHNTYKFIKHSVSGIRTPSRSYAAVKMGIYI